MKVWTKSDLIALDLLTDPCWVLDPRRVVRIWWANAAAVDAWGAPDLESLVARDLSDMSDAARARLTDTVERIDQGETVEKQWTFFPRGVPLALVCRCSAVMVDEGWRGMLCVGRQDTAALPPDDLRGLQAFRHVQAPVSLCDVGGAPLMMNQAARTAYPVPDMPLAERLADPEDADRLQQALAAGRPFGGELRVRTVNGERWHAFDARPVLDPVSGDPAIVVNERNITRRVEAEMALRRTAEDLHRARREAEALRDRAEAANRAKSQFLAVMSHELRTPMTGLKSTVDLLLTTPMTDEQTGWVKDLRSSADALTTLLNDILDFSKIEAGELRLERVGFRLADEVEDIVRVFAGTAAGKGLSLVHEVAPDTPAVVSGDPARLRQVLSNLLGNAIKFTNGGTIAVRVTGHAADADGVMVAFEVEDSGIGMDEKTRSRLFKPFEQGDVSIARRYGGTGLGLAICKRLVETMGGGIEVDSRPGVGTVFRFTLRLGPPPAAGEVRTLRRPAVADAGPTASRRVLLAEDNPTNRRLIAAMLARMGHEVEEVGDGEEALSRVAEGGIDLVLMDMHMPKMDGLEATRRIRALPWPVRDVPVVALTADAILENRARYLSAGLTEFATKPIDWQQLARLIETVIHDPSVFVDPAHRPPDTALSHAALGELLDALGEVGVRNLLRAVPMELDKLMAAIAEAAARDADEETRRHAHTLSGVAGNFGLSLVHHAARAVELREPDSSVVARLSDLSRAIAVSLAALRDWERERFETMLD